MSKPAAPPTGGTRVPEPSTEDQNLETQGSNELDSGGTQEPQEQQTQGPALSAPEPPASTTDRTKYQEVGDLPEQAYYRAVNGRLRNPRTGEVFTSNVATMAPPSSWLLCQVQAGTIQIDSQSVVRR